MNKGLIIGIVVVAVLLVGGFLYWNSMQSSASTYAAPGAAPMAPGAATPTPTPSTGGY